MNWKYVATAPILVAVTIGCSDLTGTVRAKAPLRDGPSTTANTLGHLKAESSVRLLECPSAEGDFLQVVGGFSEPRISEKSGYVGRAFVHVDDSVNLRCWIGANPGQIIAASLSLVAVILAGASYRRAKITSRTQVFRELRSSLHLIRSDGNWSAAQRTPHYEEIKDEPTRTLAKQYWYGVFDEWYITKRLDPRILGTLWDSYYRDQLTKSLEYDGLRGAIWDIFYGKGQQAKGGIDDKFKETIQEIWKSARPECIPETDWPILEEAPINWPTSSGHLTVADKIRLSQSATAGTAANGLPQAHENPPA